MFSERENGIEIGEITSGSPSPTLSRNIGLAYVSAEFVPRLGTAIWIEIRGEKNLLK